MSFISDVINGYHWSDEFKEGRVYWTCVGEWRMQTVSVEKLEGEKQLADLGVDVSRLVFQN